MEKFKFSIIMSVYQVVDYLDEAMLSLLNQDIGFEDNVHVILVDDGSTDESGELCDEYAVRYPENIEVIHKENGGLSSARNAGLLHVKGEYVNFFDPDDVLELNVLSLVYEFFEKHGDEVDLVSIPLYMFENRTGEHPLNGKFKNGSRVIDLLNDYDSVQLSVATAFIKKKVAQEMRFNEMNHLSEDMESLMEYFIHHPRYGVVADARYMYRRRISGDSILNTAQYSKSFYLFQFGMLVKEFQRAEEKFGEVPRFIQYMAMYDLQWRYVKPKEIVESILDADEMIKLNALLDSLLAKIDDDIIRKQKSIADHSKIKLLERKYKEKSVIRKKGNDLEIWMHEHNMRKLSLNMVSYEFISLENDNLILEGYIIVMGPAMNIPIDILFKVNEGEKILCQFVEGREDVEAYNLGDLVTRRVPFRGTITNVSSRPSLDISIMIKLSGHEIENGKNYHIGDFFPLLHKFKNEYVMLDDWMCFFTGNMHLRMQRVTKKEENAREEALLQEFREIGTAEAREAIVNRRIYHSVKKNISSLWLIADRVNKADDNGEALFDYLRQVNVPEEYYFVLRKDSPDWERLEKTGRAIEFQSRRHRLLHLLAECQVCSASSLIFFNPFGSGKRFYQDIIYKKRRIFLQHGITMNNVSKPLNRYKANFDKFITAANDEFRSIIDGNYFYTQDVVKLTGFARYDRLEDRREKKITVMPTWRDYLGSNNTFNVDGIRRYSISFKDSEFFVFYNTLLNHPKLLAACEKNGYTLQFMPHPGIVAAVEYFNHDPRVKFLPESTRYCDVFAESALVLTDYSSAVFDCAYLYKPVVYAQFDQKEFFSTHYKHGYFEYEKDGLGEVTYDIENTVKVLCDYIENDCCLKPLYRERIDRFFAFRDHNNCKRIYEAIRDKGYVEQHKKKSGVFDLWACESAEKYLGVLCESVKYEGKCNKNVLGKESMRYIFPTHKLPKGSNVALYGAGEVGRQFYRLNDRYHFVNITAIVDRNPEDVNAEDIPVESIERLAHVEFDYVLIALRFAEIAGQARKTLIDMGIPQEKIIWDGPLYCIDDFYKNFVGTEAR